MNNLLWIKIEYDTKYYRLTEKLYNIGINIYEIKNFSNYLLIKISYEDYEKLKNEMDSSRNSVEEILIKYNKLLDDMPLKIKGTLYIY